MTSSTAREIDSVLRPGDGAAWPVRRFAAYSDVPAGALYIPLANPSGIENYPKFTPRLP